MPLGRETAPAVVILAVVWFFAVVDAHVRLQISPLSKPFATIAPITHERFDTGMRTTMNFQPTSPRIPLATHFTSIRLLT
jgi:hypothetical protein